MNQGVRWQHGRGSFGALQIGARGFERRDGEKAPLTVERLNASGRDLRHQRLLAWLLPRLLPDFHPSRLHPNRSQEFPPLHAALLPQPGRQGLYLK